MADEEYVQLNPKAKTALYVRNAIAFIICLAMGIGAIFLIKGYDGYESWQIIPVIVILALILVYCIVGPIIYYKFYRYLVNDDKVDVRCGIIIKRRTLVPIERMHQVEVKRGPVLSMLGLSNVQVMTAGGTAVIAYLETDVANSIAEYLNSKVNSMMRDRESE